MKSTNMARNKGQVYSVGNYLMTGKVLGKGHFARVEEATHRIIGKKVAIKIIDLTCIKEEYARRNLHREPRVMAKLRHPCIAALYETMMHGPRLYVVMEAASGGDLCTHVLGARGAARGLPEAHARSLAAQLVSAVRHMHSRGVVHRDLKMENIMLDGTKQFIKIVDFGLSNMWSAGASLRTPCGSLEYAAPELFADGCRYGPEVDLWSIGVIVYGMVTGGLPFTGGGGSGGGAGGCPPGAESRSRPLLRANIAKGFTRKQRAALAANSTECKGFIQNLLEPNVDLRMKIEEAARHRWIKKPGMRMKAHPFGVVEISTNREIYRQISELCQMSVMDVVARIKAEPFGNIAGVYNIKTHLHQLQVVSGAELLWSSNNVEARPNTPPDYHPKYETVDPDASTSKAVSQATSKLIHSTQKFHISSTLTRTEPKLNVINRNVSPEVAKLTQKIPMPDRTKKSQSQSPRTIIRPLSSMFSIKKPVYKVYDNGDCSLDPRLPSIDEHSTSYLNDKVNRIKRVPFVRKVSLEEERPLRLNSCPNRVCEKRTEFYKKGGDGLPSWRASGGLTTPSARILLQSTATTIKRASLGNIISPHSSSNSQCKSERAMPVSWYSARSVNKESTHLQRFRRTAPIK